MPGGADVDVHRWELRDIAKVGSTGSGKLEFSRGATTHLSDAWEVYETEPEEIRDYNSPRTAW